MAKIGEITKRSEGDIVLRLPSVEKDDYVSLFLSEDALRVGSVKWHGGLREGSKVVGNINDLLLDIGQQALTWPEQPKQRLVRVREMPKTGQFVVVRMHNELPWSHTLRWEGSVLKGYSASTDTWHIRNTTPFTPDAMFFIYSSEET